ncbi:MAG: glycosyltransferase 87 family protein [Nibricoccus sp.]
MADNVVVPNFSPCSRLERLWMKARFFLKEAFLGNPAVDAKWFPRYAFWAAFAIGLLIRGYLVVFTSGTYDVGIWRDHAMGIHELGLMGYYRANPLANHPPVACVLISSLFSYSEWFGVPFSILLRAPFAALDVGILLLLLYLLRDRPMRFLAGACYWLNPAVLILSAYHGNTDNVVGFSVLLSIVLLSKDRPIAAGVALGLGLWIKLPGMLAIPVLFFAAAWWKRRFQFLVAVGATAMVAFLPAMMSDFSVVWRNVFGYRGQMLHSTNGTLIWGLINVFARIYAAVGGWSDPITACIAAVLGRGQMIAYVVIAVFAIMRKAQRTGVGIGVTLAAAYGAVYAFSPQWAFQYLLWSMPLWFLLPVGFYLPAVLVASSYIYFLYWFLCGDPWLLGPWDFIGNPRWPPLVLLARDASVAFFTLTTFVFFVFFAKNLKRKATPNLPS